MFTATQFTYKLAIHYKYILFYISLFIVACKPPEPKEKDVVKNPVQLRNAIKENLETRIDFLSGDNVHLENITNVGAVILFYRQNKFQPIWSDSSLWLSHCDSLIHYLIDAPSNGIDTQFLHLTKIISLYKKSKTDSLSVYDAALYAHADVLMTDAYFNYANRLCYSQNSPDTIRIRKPLKFSDSLLISLLTDGIHSHNLMQSILKFEPKHRQYSEIKIALRNYLMDFLNAVFTKVPDTISQTIAFKKLLKIRLLESCDYDSMLYQTDSLKLVFAIKSFQTKHGLFPDGVPGKRTLMAMNKTFEERISQINNTLDQWRAEPDTFPNQFIYVNLPSYYLEYWLNDTLQLASKIICGSLDHKSPLLNSKINYFVLYPYWTVPFSIATKEILPHLKKDTSYLRKQKMEVLNYKREVIDATKINWKKYSKTYFPFILRQREGLDNSLGVVKFIFPSSFGIYLHETNTRNYFKKDFRALSHGCIRVEQAVKLAYQLAIPDSIKYPADSIKHWLNTKTKKQINVSKKIPLYIRYNLCSAINGKIIFYEDCYDYFSFK